jgi:hypothetical protein
METYVARRSGSVGHEILSDGEVVAWTVDRCWAALIAGLLNGAEGLIPGVPTARREHPALMHWETRPPDGR